MKFYQCILPLIAFNTVLAAPHNGENHSAMGMGSSSAPSSTPSSPPCSSAPPADKPIDILEPIISSAMSGTGDSTTTMVKEFIDPIVNLIKGGVPIVKNLLGGFDK